MSLEEINMNLPSDQLIVTLWKLYKGASIVTMRRRMKEVFVKNNIDFLLIAIRQHQLVKPRA